ncbi:flagellar hook-basal body complex protein FliE [Legionella micdadei]|uniref:Flagellar hook-basal body complex protein FliE n=1 Tax=Legionella micdadei TaxID=451 RepID=A0A098GGL3_LEGMI|nr:flagellar hook-basal body complex protein FliE [Legionella micdadei]ARG96964.1 flagellar hook-basal body complex protein FliE [Legionella micdadei]ARH00781.1 flagellar hook-basal body complex protein FliE [Legionella micdadei]KTD26674.1 Flagellar hook-basal body complex protein FliE [Legionella micdadei]NSL19479.1 flagellar hook-basal body complex protein FliE [Legionella micdadei]CEG61629.1 Flagellar hook-basal body complex protein fliE 2 [Legionella micdadei]
MKLHAPNAIGFNSEIKTIEQVNQSTPSFAGWLTEKLGETNNQLQASDYALQQLASGQTINLHQAMLTLEQAKLSLQFLEQVRNRLMSAYQEIMREQI